MQPPSQGEASARRAPCHGQARPCDGGFRQREGLRRGAQGVLEVRCFKFSPVQTTATPRILQAATGQVAAGQGVFLAQAQKAILPTCDRSKRTFCSKTKKGVKEIRGMEMVSINRVNYIPLIPSSSKHYSLLSIRQCSYPPNVTISIRVIERPCDQLSSLL